MHDVSSISKSFESALTSYGEAYTQEIDLLINVIDGSDDKVKQIEILYKLCSGLLKLEQKFERYQKYFPVLFLSKLPLKLQELLDSITEPIDDEIGRQDYDKAQNLTENMRLCLKFDSIVDCGFREAYRERRKTIQHNKCESKTNVVRALNVCISEMDYQKFALLYMSSRESLMEKDCSLLKKRQTTRVCSE